MGSQGLRPGDLGAYSISVRPLAFSSPSVRFRAMFLPTSPGLTRGQQKTAANQFFLRLSLEYETRGVKVINVHPGLVDTPMSLSPFPSVDSRLALCQNRAAGF